MKYIVAATVVLLIIVFPIASWYYLQTGFNYRKDNLKDLEPKGIIQIDSAMQTIFKGHTSLVDMYGASSNDLKKIYDQYEDSYTFQLMSVTAPSKDWKVLPDSLNQQLKIAYPDFKFLLVDTSLQVRNMYGNSNEEMKKMIEQVAIALPRKKEKDIKIKR